MREIKFRAWDRENRTMITTGVDFGLAFLSKPADDLPADDFIGYGEKFARYFDVMQFTGLHDKDGKEIYEGDIVEFTAYTKFREQSENRTKVVTYSCEPNGRVGFTPMVWHTDVEDDYYNYEIENIRVIGNVHENPELLEDK